MCIWIFYPTMYLNTQTFRESGIFLQRDSWELLFEFPGLNFDINMIPTWDKTPYPLELELLTSSEVPQNHNWFAFM